MCTRFLMAACLVATAMFVNSPRLAHAQTTNWQVDAGFVFLNRDGGSNAPVAVDTAHANIVNSSQLETGFHTGFNVELTKRWTDEYSINARHFNVDDWTELDGSSSNNGVWLYGSSSYGGNTIDHVASVFSASLYSTEINLVHQFSDRVSLLAGFRWLSIHDDLHMAFTAIPIDYADYDGYVKNDLYGFQGGANILLFDNGGPFTLNSSVKAGVYGNDARNNLQYETPSAALGTVVDEELGASFVGEIGVMGSLFLTDRISLSAGYQLLWVEGIAKLSDQLGAVNWGNNSGISNDEGLFYHGAVVNLTFLSR